MEKLFQVKFIFILCITIIIVPAQSSTFENRWKIYSVQPDTEDKVHLLRRWQSNAELDFFGAVQLNKSVSIMVGQPTIDRFEQQLAENGLEKSILVDDVEAFAQPDHNESPKMKRSVLTTTSEFTFNHYWTYEEFYLYLNMLSTTFSNMTTLTTVGYSAEDREIMALEISFSDKANKSVVYLDSGMVAREKAGPMTLLYLIRELVENWQTNLDVLTDVDWVIVPLLNPDGLSYAQNVHQFWAKSRAVIPGSTCRGVHLNRNYESNWMEKGSSDDPCSVNFAGTDPMSEPESAAVDLLLNVYYLDRIKVSANIHAAGSLLLYPFFRSEEEWSPNQRDLQILGMTFVNTMRASRPFYMGHGAEIGGEMSGTSTDYAHETLGIPYTYKILLPEGGQYGFDYPARQLEALCKEMYYGFLVFGRFVRDNFRPT